MLVPILFFIFLGGMTLFFRLKYGESSPEDRAEMDRKLREWEKISEAAKRESDELMRKREAEKERQLTEADIRNFVNRVESAGYNVDFLKKK